MACRLLRVAAAAAVRRPLSTRPSLPARRPARRAGDPKGSHERSAFEASGLELVLDKDTQSVKRFKDLLQTFALSRLGQPPATSALALRTPAASADGRAAAQQRAAGAVETSLSAGNGECRTLSEGGIPRVWSGGCSYERLPQPAELSRIISGQAHQ